MSDFIAAGASADDLPAPAEGLLLTHFLTVGDIPRSRAFYADVLGGQVVLEENHCIIKVTNSWIIMNPGGGPTDDKPDVVLRPPEDRHTASSFLNVRVADIHGFYAAARAKGAEFLTPPMDRRADLRCYRYRSLTTAPRCTADRIRQMRRTGSVIPPGHACAAMSHPARLAPAW